MSTVQADGNGGENRELVAMGGIELDYKLLNCRQEFCSIPIVTVKATVSSAGFDWTRLDLAGRNYACPAGASVLSVELPTALIFWVTPSTHSDVIDG